MYIESPLSKTRKNEILTRVQRLTNRELYDDTLAAIETADHMSDASDIFELEYLQTELTKRLQSWLEEDQSGNREEKSPDPR